MSRRRSFEGNARPIYDESEPPTDVLEIAARNIPEWQANAACSDNGPEDFYCDQNTVEGKEVTERMKAVCEPCGVKDECLEHAMANRENFGIWGGYTPRERVNLERKRRRIAKKKQQALEQASTGL